MPETAIKNQTGQTCAPPATAQAENCAALNAPAANGARTVPEIMQSWTPEQREALNGKRIAYVDDNASLLEIYTDLIAMTGAHATPVHHNGQSAQALASQLQEFKPDVVLLDGTLRDGVTGVHVMQALQNTPNGHKPVIIGFSGEADRCAEFKSSGAHGAVLKSISQVSANLAEVAEIVLKSS